MIYNQGIFGFGWIRLWAYLQRGGNIMKKLISMLGTLGLCVCVLCAMVTTAAAEEPYALTRGNTCMIIAEELGKTSFGLSESEVSQLTNQYPDLSPAAEYYEAVLICTELGLIKGYGDGRFKPEQAVTTAEAVTILLNAAGVDAGAGTWPMTVMSKAEELGLLDVAETKPGTNEQCYSNQIDFAYISRSLGNVLTRPVQMDIGEGAISIQARNTKQIFDYTQNGETIRSTGGIIVRQSGSTTSNTITVSRGEVEMTLYGVDISSGSASPVTVNSGAHLVLTLLGDNTLTATEDYAGLAVPAGAELTIDGSGTLIATGGIYSAGIGGAEATEIVVQLIFTAVL